MSQLSYRLLLMVVLFTCSATANSYRRHHHHNVPPPSKIPLHPNYSPPASSPTVDVHIEEEPCANAIVIKEPSVATVVKPCVQTVPVSIARPPVIGRIPVAVPQPPSIHNVPVSVPRPPIVQNVPVSVPRPPIVQNMPVTVSAAAPPCAKVPGAQPPFSGYSITDHAHDGLENIKYGKGFGNEFDHTHDPPGTVTIALPDSSFVPSKNKPCNMALPDFEIPSAALPAAVAAAGANVETAASSVTHVVPAANKHHVHPAVQKPVARPLSPN